MVNRGFVMNGMNSKEGSAKSEGTRTSRRAARGAMLTHLIAMVLLLASFAGDALAVYSPRTGRFLQKDPNESGMLHSALWHDGIAPMPELAEGSIHGSLMDGSNLFTFVGNEPVNRTDPTGLFFGLAAQALNLGFSSWMSASGSLEEARQGVLITLETDQQLSGYASDQLDMVEWALDWEQSDDFGMPTQLAVVERGGDNGPAIAGASGSFRRPINYKFRADFFKKGKIKYKGKKIPFDRRGFPKFDDFAVADVKIVQTGNRGVDDRLANKAAKAQYGSNWKKPEGYTWHHHQDRKRMLLIPTKLHKMVGHTGGVAMRNR